jgi:hypothetical protein
LETCAFYARCDVRIPGTCDTVPTPVRHMARGADISCCHTEANLLALQAPLAPAERATIKETS